MHQRFNTVVIDAVAKYAEVASSDAVCDMLARQVRRGRSEKRRMELSFLL
jgi:hypothetical protein